MKDKKETYTPKEAMISSSLDQPVFKPHVVYGAVTKPPSPKQIANLRKHLGLTQSQVATILDLSNRQLIGSYEKGRKTPNPQTWTLFLLLTGQHPTLKVSQR